MLHTLRLPRALPAVLAVLALALTGCSGDESPSTTSSPSDSDNSSLPSDEELAEASGGNPDRAFGSTDDAVVTAVEAALDPQKVEWDGKSLRVYVEGSIDDPAPGLNCIALHSLIADDEQGVFVYADGEYDCNEMR